MAVLLRGIVTFGYSAPFAMDLLEEKLGHKITADTLAEILRAKAHDHRFDVVLAAGELGADAKSLVPFLIAALADDDRRIRNNAAHALWKIGPDAAVAVPALIRTLDDTDDYVSNNAASALGSIGPAAKAAVPALIALLRGIDRRNGPGNVVPWLAAESLGKIGPRAKDAVPVLISILRHRDSSNDVRREAARALGSIVAMPDAAVLEVLTTTARLEAGGIELAVYDSGTSAEARGRIAAALSIQKIGHDARVIPWLIATAEHEKNDAFIREEAVKALAEIGPDASAAVPVLVSLANDWLRGEHVNSYGVLAITALGKIGGDARVAIPDLVKHVDLKYGEGMSTRAVRALGDIGPAASEVLPLLVQAMGVSDQLGHSSELRISAAEAIRKIGGETGSTVPVLVEILAIQETWCFWSRFVGVREGAALRRQAARALAELGPGAKAAVPALKTLATDDFITVREAAEQALRQIEREPTP